MAEEFGSPGDAVEMETVKKLIQTNKRHRRVLEKRLNVTKVFRSQHQLLMFIVRHPNLSQIQLARMQGISTAAIAVSLKKLEKGGYVKRAVDSKDNRYNQIQITEKGMEMARYSTGVFREVEQIMFRGFSREELQVLGGLLDRVYKNLESSALTDEGPGREEEQG